MRTSAAWAGCDHDCVVQADHYWRSGQSVGERRHRGGQASGESGGEPGPEPSGQSWRRREPVTRGIGNAQAGASARRGWDIRVWSPGER